MIFYVIKVNKRRNIEFIKNCRTDGLRPRKINFQCPPNNGERILDSVEDVANDDLRAFTEPRLITFTHCFEPMKTQPQIRQIADPLAAQNAMQEAADLLRGGGVIVCATDTGYLLGVDALNVAAVQKAYAIKGRAFHKPMHVVVADIEMARMIADISPQAQRVFEQFLPGALTLILRRKPIVPDLLVSGLPGIGIRIPQNDFLLELARTANMPITATSANQSGLGTPYTVAQVLQELGEAAAQVDLILDQGETAHAMPSTLLDLTQSPPRILRRGPITVEMLRAKGVDA